MPPVKRYTVANDYLSGNLPTAAPAPLAVWDLDGTVDALTDRGVNGHDLVLHSGSVAYDSAPLGELVGFDNRVGTNWLKAPAIEAFRIARDRLDGGDAALTIEMVVAVASPVDGALIGSWASGESEATNFLYVINPLNSTQWYSFNEYGNGSDIKMYFDANGAPRYSTANGLYLPNYIVLTVDTTGNIRQIWQNGFLIEEINTTKARKETSGNAQVTYLGGVPNSIIHSVRMTAGTYTQAQIEEVWEDIKAEVEVLSLPENQNQAGLEDDSVELFGMGGPPSHQHPPLPRGWAQPGPSQMPYPANPEVFTSPMSTGGLEPDEEEREVGHAHVFGRDDWKQKQQGALDDEATAWEGGAPQYNHLLTDANGNAYFVASDRWYSRGFVYDTTDEPWRNPTAHADFTGYGTDGTHYTNGVQDVGPVYAPWYSETPSSDRGNRPEFPVRVLIVVSELEITIFDLDNFPTGITVWMRCRWPDGTSAYWRFGYEDFFNVSVFMLNGVLYWGSQIKGSAQGRFNAHDFKRDGDREAGILLDSTNHWYLNTGIDITDRHVTSNFTSGVSSNRLTNNYVWRMTAYLDPDDITHQWVVIGGEDSVEVVHLYNNEIDDMTGMAPTPTANRGDYRCVYIAYDGMLWWSQGNYVVRNGYGYQGGDLIDPTNKDEGDADPMRRHPYIKLPFQVLSLVVGKNHAYAATEAGIYAIEKTTLRSWLAYTVVGGGGGGRLNNPPDGEILLGTNHFYINRDDTTPNNRSGLPQLGMHHARLSDYLSVGTLKQDKRGEYSQVGESTAREGGVAVIRLYDDVLIHKNKQGLPPNPLSERGVFFVKAYTV